MDWKVCCEDFVELTFYLWTHCSTYITTLQQFFDLVSRVYLGLAMLKLETKNVTTQQKTGDRQILVEEVPNYLRAFVL